jgi:error-prone DNA polymerase
MVAAGFSAGEADQLRRAIASWRKTEKLARFRQRLIDGMTARGYSAEFGAQIYDQIQGFGEYGFPESHAASFALLAYASAWLKRHEPAAFTCALLNSYPMGFYAPAQLIQDARRHGVELRPLDVRSSEWECTLERRDNGELAIRIGFRMTKGLRKATAERITGARSEKPFENLRDFSRRTGLSRPEMEKLAAAGALAALAGHRHRARWRVLGLETPPPLFAAGEGSDRPLPFPPLPAPSEGDDMKADYENLGFTLGRHPLALLRPLLRKRRTVTAEQLKDLTHGTAVQTSGLVTIRQRPGSAKGVLFLTLEDETGTSNIIVWPNLLEKQRKVVLGASLLGVWGELQREGEVIHIVAHRLSDQTDLLGSLVTQSRDFH